MTERVKELQTEAQRLTDAGYSVIAVNSLTKMPLGSWKQNQVERILPHISRGNSIALVCGKVSGGLECIDLDLKYSIDPQADWEKIKSILKKECKGWVKQVVIEASQNGGYHILYRCDEVQGNQKIASRPLTQQEIDAAESVGVKPEQHKTIVETRGEGGYFVCAPSDGYTIMSGDFATLKPITVEMRRSMLAALKAMDTMPKPTKDTTPRHLGVSPFDDFNDRGDIIDVLEKHFTITKERGNKIYLKRTGSTSHGAHGAEYDSDLKKLYVWTGNSGVFEPNRAYNHTQVYHLIDGHSSYSETHHKLRDMGFGDTWSSFSPEAIKFQEEVVVNAYDSIATADEIEVYLEAVREGRIQMGLPYRINRLDDHLVYKRANLIMNIGHANLGKSTVSWYQMVLLNKWYGLRGLIFSSENKEGQIARSFIQFRFGKKITEMTADEYSEAKIWFYSNFKIIKSDFLYTYKDILTIAKMVIRSEPFDTLLIDPYNSLDVDFKSVKGESEYRYHLRALTEMRIYCKTYDCAVFLNAHCNTAALRFKDKNGFPVPPQEGDVEGGGSFVNRADDMFATHRLKKHPERWMYTELHVHKIKDTETGGKPTPYEFPVLLRMRKDGCGFEDELNRDPMTWDGKSIFDVPF